MKIYFVLLFLSTQAFSFNMDKCHKVALRGVGIGYVVSTSSFISSTGDCSMLGLVKHDQKLFIAQAYEPLQIDIARGSGDFSTAFADISKCNSLGKIVLKRALQKNYGKIYQDANFEDVEKTHSEILNVMKSDQVIIKNCQLDS